MTTPTVTPWDLLARHPRMTVVCPKMGFLDTGDSHADKPCPTCDGTGRKGLLLDACPCIVGMSVLCSSCGRVPWGMGHHSGDCQHCNGTSFVPVMPHVETILAALPQIGLEPHMEMCAWDPKVLHATTFRWDVFTPNLLRRGTLRKAPVTDPKAILEALIEAALEAMEA